MLCCKTYCCVMNEKLGFVFSCKKHSIHPYELRKIVNVKKSRDVHASISFKQFEVATQN